MSQQHPPSSPPEDIYSPPEDMYSPPLDPFTAHRLEKLQLEVENLRLRNKRLRQYAAIIPSWALLLTTFAALGGVVLGLYKDREDRQRAAALRVQTQIRENVSQLLQYPNDEKQNVSRMVFLFGDLDYLLANPLIKSGDGDFDVKQLRKQMDERLTHLIAYDLNFETSRGVAFDVAAMGHWPGYSMYLQVAREQHEYILNKYVESLFKLRAQYPEVLSTILYDERRKNFNWAGRTEDEKEFPRVPKDLFDDLKDGFGSHLRLLKKDDPVRLMFVEEIKSATNPTFGGYYEKAHLPELIVPDTSSN